MTGVTLPAAGPKEEPPEFSRGRLKDGGLLTAYFVPRRWPNGRQHFLPEIRRFSHHSISLAAESNKDTGPQPTPSLPHGKPCTIPRPHRRDHRRRYRQRDLIRPFGIAAGDILIRDQADAVDGLAVA